MSDEDIRSTCTLTSSEVMTGFQAEIPTVRQSVNEKSASVVASSQVNTHLQMSNEKNNASVLKQLSNETSSSTTSFHVALPQMMSKVKVEHGIEGTMSKRPMKKRMNSSMSVWSSSEKRVDDSDRLQDDGLAQLQHKLKKQKMEDLNEWEQNLFSLHRTVTRQRRALVQKQRSLFVRELIVTGRERAIGNVSHTTQTSSKRKRLQHIVRYN